MSFNSIFLTAMIGISGFVFIASGGKGSNSSSCKSQPRCWGTNTPFVQQVIHSIQTVERSADKLNFYVYGYHGRLSEKGLQSNNNPENQKFPESWITDVSQHNNARWITGYGRSVTRAEITAATTIDEVIHDYPTLWLKDYEYESVWINTRFDDEYISAMSETNELSKEQLDFFKRAVIGTRFDFVINFTMKDSVSGKSIAERMNINLSVVPETEAEFPGGYDKLIAYFDLNSRDLLEKNNLILENMVRIKFKVNTEGIVKIIELKRSSGLNEVDEQMMQMVREMPPWKPALNAAGDLVEQSFEFVYGQPGC